MTSMRTTRLAELAAPARAKPRYAPLTAGLLARKGEAAPATSFFTADPMSSHGASRLALPDDLGADWAMEARWHARRQFEETHDIAGGAEPALETPEFFHAAPASHPEAMSRASLQVDLDLEILARLALEARRSATTPSRLVEIALAANLP